MPEIDQAVTEARVRSGGANATIIMATILVAASIYLLQGILAPFLAAVFFLIVIGGLSRLIRKVAPGTPRAAAMGIAVIMIMTAFAAVAWITVDNTAQLLTDADSYAARLNQAFLQLQRSLGVATPARIETMLRGIDTSSLVGAVAGWLRVGVSSAGFMLIYLGFMMASGRTFSRKLLAITGARAELQGAKAVFEGIREAVASYIWVQTATGFLIALVSWVLLWTLGVPSPIFWAFVIFVTSYVPIVGGVVGVFLPVLFAVAVMGEFGTPLLLFAGLQTVQILVGNVLQPRMQGDSLNIDPVAVLLSLGIWGLLLGPVGALLSTPLTVTAMVILAQFPRTKWMAILLSSDARPVTPPPSADQSAKAPDQTK